jgi:hypothetical protein
MPSIGTYDPQNNTIADNVRKRVEQGAGNPLLASMKNKAQIPFSSVDTRFKERKINENDRFLGPGYYEVKTFINETKQKPVSNAGIFNSKVSTSLTSSGK